MRNGPGTNLLRLSATLLLAGMFLVRGAHAEDLAPGGLRPMLHGDLDAYRFMEKEAGYFGASPGTPETRRKGYPVLEYVTLATPDPYDDQPRTSYWRPRLFVTARFGQGRDSEYFLIEPTENQAPLQTALVQEFPAAWKKVEVWKASDMISVRDPQGVLYFISAVSEGLFASKVPFSLSIRSVHDRDPVTTYLGDLIHHSGCIDHPELLRIEIDMYDDETRNRDYPPGRNFAFVLPYSAPPGSEASAAKGGGCPAREKARPSSLANIGAKSQFAPTSKTLYVASRYSVYALPLDSLLQNAKDGSGARETSFLATQDHIIARLKAARAQYDADPARQEACAVRWADCVQDMVDQAYLAAARD